MRCTADVRQSNVKLREDSALGWQTVDTDSGAALGTVESGSKEQPQKISESC